MPSTQMTAEVIFLLVGGSHFQTYYLSFSSCIEANYFYTC